MKRLMVLFLASLCAMGTRVSAQTPEQIFLQADTLYQQGKFAEAIQAYEKISGAGYVSGELYYNLGNAYYKAGSMAKAILNYERAMRIMPADDDLRHNLQLANMMITDKIEPVPRLFLWDYWDGLKNAFSLRGILWTTFAVFVMVLGAVALFILGTSYAIKRVALWTGTATLVVLLFGLTILFARASDARRDTDAIVTGNIVTVKNSPDQHSTDAFVLHSGVKVRMVDRVGSWVKIRLADGKLGWMEMEGIEVI